MESGNEQSFLGMSSAGDALNRYFFGWVVLAPISAASVVIFMEYSKAKNRDNILEIVHLI